MTELWSGGRCAGGLHRAVAAVSRGEAITALRPDSHPGLARFWLMVGKQRREICQMISAKSLRRLMGEWPGRRYQGGAPTTRRCAFGGHSVASQSNAASCASAFARSLVTLRRSEQERSNSTYSYWVGFSYSLTPAVGRAIGVERLVKSMDRNARWRTATVVPLPSCARRAAAMFIAATVAP